MKLDDYLDIWLNKYSRHTIKPRTYISYKRIISIHINPILGDYELEDLKPEILQDFILNRINKGGTRSKTLSFNTVINIFSALKQALKFAVKIGIIDKEYTGLVRMPRGRERKITAFEKDEQDKLVRFCMTSGRKNHM